VASLSLDPGSYVFVASARLFSTGAGTVADCYLAPAGGSAHSNFANVNLGASPDRKFVSLNYATTLSSSVTVNFNCGIAAEMGDSATADEVFFTAIKVGAVH
jgi:hypothetical protein